MCCIIIKVEDLYNFCGHRRCCWKFLYTIHVLHVYIFTSIWIHHSCNMYHEIPVLFYVSHIYTSSIFFFILIMYTLLLYSSLYFSGKVFYIHPLIVYCDFVNLFTFSKSSGGFLLSFCTVSYYISSPNCSIKIKKRTGTCNSEICTASGIFMNANISIMHWIYAVFTEK